MKKTTTPTTVTLNKMTPSWDLVKPNFVLIREHYLAVIYLVLLPSLVVTLGSTLAGSATTLTAQSGTGIGILLLGLVWSIINLGPLTLLQLRAADGTTNTVGEYYRDGLRFSGRLFVFYLAYSVAVLIGLLLLIVPGLIMIRRYALANYYLVDQDLSVSTAMQTAKAASKPYSGAIWGVLGVQLVFVLLAGLIQQSLSYPGIILGELVASLYVFIIVLRYREIQRRA